MASRSKRFTHSLITGYGAIGVNMAFSLISVPLALSYLSKQEFGLWALALQITGYLSLIDLGMSAAIGRFLADHKDDVKSDAYAAHFATGNFVFVIQALLIVALGMVISSFAPALLSISPELTNEFKFLLRILCVVSGLSIASRCLAAPLWGFQRMDVVNIAASIGLFFQFLTMWLGFHLGYGVRSFAVAGATPNLLAGIVYAIVCSRNGYYPSWHRWFSPRWSIFKQMFAYGRDGMLLAIGSQLVNATQITIISRTLGLDAAASFSIATKLYSMSVLLFQKVVESAAPGLAEMYVRGESTQFVRRYWDMIFLTLATSSVGAIALAAGNSAFILVWTGGKVTWSVQGDLLLGLMVLLTSLSRSFISVFGVTKNLQPVRIIYFIEGIVFVPCAIIAAKWYGLEGVLVASLMVHTGVTLLSSSKAASKIIGSLKPLIPTLILSLASIAIVYIMASIVSTLDVSLTARLVLAALPVMVSTVPIWFIVLPHQLRSRLLLSFQGATNGFRRAD